jgi:DNA-binding MarR family transcriptional regulator
MSDKLKRQFFIAPIRALSDERLTFGTFKVLCLVCSYCDKKGITWVSQQTLSEDMNVSRQAITNQIIKLRKLGYIEIIKKGHRHSHSNTIRVIFDESQPNVSQLEVDDFEQKKKVLEMINKAFNRPPQIDAAKQTNRSESPTVKAMKEHIKLVKTRVS